MERLALDELVLRGLSIEGELLQILSIIIKWHVSALTSNFSYCENASSKIVIRGW